MLNHDYLNEISGGDAEFIAEILGDFLRETPSLIAQIESAVAQGDASALGKAAHTLKGSARAVGAEAFAAIAFELEQAGKGGDLSDAPDALQRLQAHWQQLAQYLHEQVQAA
ncbi:MAG: Hpt domain-containing protein [Fimbriimonadales bacterium]|nr:Hpt domain-containing protein [Fimbriimonadales bacterium]